MAKSQGLEQTSAFGRTSAQVLHEDAGVLPAIVKSHAPPQQPETVTHEEVERREIVVGGAQLEPTPATHSRETLEREHQVVPDAAPALAAHYRDGVQHDHALALVGDRCETHALPPRPLLA